jgi:hypothetical protein
VAVAEALVTRQSPEGFFRSRLGTDHDGGIDARATAQMLARGPVGTGLHPQVELAPGAVDIDMVGVPINAPSVSDLRW